MPRAILLAALLAALACHGHPARGSEIADQLSAPQPPMVREILVPFDDLDAMLEHQPRRMLLSRTEYDALLKKAGTTTPEATSPYSAQILSADYHIAVESRRAVFSGTLVVDVLKDGLRAVALDFGGVALRNTTLDGRKASLAVSPAPGNSGGTPVLLFLEGRGRHKLKLELLAPLETTAARQVLHFRLPQPPSVHTELTVPGDVEVKSGAAVASRVVDKAAGLTRFELVSPRGDVAVVMTLNSHLARQERAVVAHSVFVAEITQAYERLHATIDMEILHKAVDSFRFVVPEGFEVTEVTSPALARWSVQPDGARKVLEVRLREQTTEAVVLSLTASRTPARLNAWTLPRLEPLDVVGQAAVFGLLVEERLKTESLSAEGLIAIDTADLGRALPGSLLRAEPGAPTLVPVAAYYAPQSQFGLRARFTRPAAKTRVRTDLQLLLGEQGQQLHGTVLAQPEAEKLFSLDFSLPAHWQVTAVTAPGGRPLAFERDAGPAQTARIRVKLPAGLPPGKQVAVGFQASWTPPGWLDEWKTQKVDFPAVAVPGTEWVAGTIAVETRDDMTAQTEKLDQLTPLDGDCPNFRLGENGTVPFGLSATQDAHRLAYRCEGPAYQAALRIERTRPRITALTISFVRVAPDALVCHDEIIYQVQNARTRRLSLALPASTPEKLYIHGLDGLRIKEFTPEPVANGQRRWTVLLEQAQQGRVRLAVEFQQPLAVSPEKSPKLALPLASAEGVVYQSGLFAVEGSAELDVKLETAGARRVDVGELADADHQPGRRLLGAFAFAGDPSTVKATVAIARPAARPLPPAIVEEADLTTLLSAQGVSLTSASFSLRTGALLLEVQLPPESELWSAHLNDQPLKPQREGDRLLVGLPAATGAAICNLRIVYETPVRPVGLDGKIELTPPSLQLHAASGAQGVAVPLADLAWHVQLPSGYAIVRSDGSLVTKDIQPPEPAALTVLKEIEFLSGGISGGLLVPSVYFARERGRFMVPAPTSAPCAKPAACAKPSCSEKPVCAAPPAGHVNEVTTEQWDAAKRAEAGAKSGLADRKARFLEREATRDAELGSRAATAPLPQWQHHAPAGGPAPTAGKIGGGDPSSVVTSGTDALVDLGVRYSLAESGQPFVFQGTTSTTNNSSSGGIQTSPSGTQILSRRNLEGVRSLDIRFQEDPDSEGRTVSFHSLGEVAPRIEVTLANQTRYGALGWAVALAVALLGVALTGRSVRCKLRFLLTVGILSGSAPLVVEHVELAWVANMAFFAVSLLVPYYLLAALLRWCWGPLGRLCCPRHAATAAIVLLLAAGLAAVARAEEPSTAGQKGDSPIFAETKIGTVPYVIQVVAPGPPVHVPDDVILRPYDPKSPRGISDATKLLIPYAKYVELWNRAYPDKRLEATKPPAEYALGGAAYHATLEGDHYLAFTGQMEIDVYAEGFVSVPLGLQGGVLARAEVDGKPARLSAAGVERPLAVSQTPQTDNRRVPDMRNGTGPVPDAARLVLLYLSGKGRHKLDLEVRLGLERRGGWRIVDGVLPSAPATAVALLVPRPQTEVRLARVADGAAFESKQPAETLETALGPGGAIGIQWRPKVAEAEVDQSLSVRSAATLDVQEEGLRLNWQLQLAFRRGQRESFRLLVPKDYLVEKVSGANVRGWEVRPAEKGQTVEVSLLKAARDSETLSLCLTHHSATGSAAFDVPVVEAEGASLHSGRLLIRRSPRLEVRLLETTGVARTDLEAGPSATAGDGPQSPLGIRPLAALDFAATPFTVRLSAAPLAAKLTAQTQTVLRISEYERSVESRIVLSASAQPLYSAEIFLPDDFELRQVVAPGDFQWAETKHEGRRLLSIYLAAGREGEVPLLLRGRLGRPGVTALVPLPQFVVCDAQRQEGQIAVQLDPAFDVEATEMKGCQSVLPGQLYGWLNPEQRELTRLAIAYQQANHSAMLRLTPRKPEVTCYTISDVRVTTRAIEETIHLVFTVRNAGVRELEFLLPKGKEEPRIQVPMLRQKTIEPAGTAADPWLRVRLELQDERMGEIRVQIESDRVLTAGNHAAPIPVVKTGRTDRQFVTLETAGRDEVVVDPPQGLEPVERQQKEWQLLKNLFGQIAQAYLVSPGAVGPKLVFHTHAREAVELVGARIGLAETELVLDAHGGYRAETTYWMDNATEQFLQVRLPAGAKLWTAEVAGEPVKPAEDPAAADAQQVRVPLVKTAAGDTDYKVVLKYAGAVRSLDAWGRVDFPLPRTTNVKPERSQVRLLVPPTYQWMNFGGTMRLVEANEADAGRIGYNTKVAERLVQTLRSGDEFAKERAAENLKSLTALTDNQDVGGKVLKEALQELSAHEQQTAPAAINDNRDKLNKLFAGQQNKAARNIANDVVDNWQGASVNRQAVTKPESAQSFNAEWFEKHNLSNAQPQSMPAAQTGGQQAYESTEQGNRSPAEKKIDEQLHAPSQVGFVEKRNLSKPQHQPTQKAQAGARQKYESTGPANRGATENKIDEQLHALSHVDFVETPLSEVIDYLKDLHGIEIQLDTNALKGLGVAADTPISKNLKGISLKSVLKLILEPLQLTYTIKNEVLLITSQEKVAADLTTIVYPVADLVLARDASGEESADFDSLIELMTSTVKSSTWDAVGGPGSIAGFETNLSLTISQTQEVHEEIRDLLKQLRSADGGTRPYRRRAPAANAPGTGGMGGMMGGMGGGMGGNMGGRPKNQRAAASPSTPAQRPPSTSYPSAAPQPPMTHLAAPQPPAPPSFANPKPQEGDVSGRKAARSGPVPQADLDSLIELPRSGPVPQPAAVQQQRPMEEGTLQRYKKQIAQKGQPQSSAEQSDREAAQPVFRGSGETFNRIAGPGPVPGIASPPPLPQPVADTGKATLGGIVKITAGGGTIRIQPPVQGLASLAVTLPKPADARVYCFTAPQGDVEITGWAVSQKLIDGLVGLAVALGALLAIWLVLLLARRGGFAWMGSRWGSTLLILAGVAMVLLGLFPVAGLAAVVAGTVVKVRLSIKRHAAKHRFG